MVIAESDTANWLSAISTAVLGVLGLVVTVFQFWANGFRAKAIAEIEPARDAMRLRLTNRGRGSGTITRVVVTSMSTVEHPGYRVAGLVGGFKPVALPAKSSMSLVIEALDNHKFSEENRIVVEWGTTTRTLVPQPVDVGLYGLKSVLPRSGTD